MIFEIQVSLATGLKVVDSTSRSYVLQRYHDQFFRTTITRQSHYIWSNSSNQGGGISK